jgi:hypothetical protein
VSRKASPQEVIASYTAAARAADLIAHYEVRLRQADLPFEITPDDNGASIDVAAKKASALVRIHETGGAATIDVKYALMDEPPAEAPAPPILPPLPLEWPDWLQVPQARLTSQRTNPPGRIGVGTEDTCPGDVIGQPSQGCLKKVYVSSLKLNDAYEYMSGLLEQYGYSAQPLNAQPNANVGLGKWISGALASLTMREYPEPRQENYYRQLDIFLRQPGARSTTVEVTFLVKGGQAPGTASLSGVWTFTHLRDRFHGTIELKQAGSEITGTWHTATGKNEADTAISGQVEGNTVRLTRMVGDNQNYVLTLSADGNRLDGFGNGWFVNHANLNMQRVPPPAPSADVPPPATTATHSGLSFPPPHAAWKWAIQCVAMHRGSEIKYNSFYYEAATDRSVEEPLNLPGGGDIVGVSPNDCGFSARDEAGHSYTFRNEAEAKSKGLGPGTWSVYPMKCGGVAVFVK